MIFSPSCSTADWPEAGASKSFSQFGDAVTGSACETEIGDMASVTARKKAREGPALWGSTTLKVR